MKYTVFLMNGNHFEGYSKSVKLVNLSWEDVVNLLKLIKGQDIALYTEEVGD